MYDLHDYARMIADEARMGPYVRALERTVRPESVVVDLGSGVGIFALVACRLGARRVYAIDTNGAIEVGRHLARENGFAEKIVFFHEDARQVELPERADLIVSDLRGMVPLFGDHLAVIADVRERFLKAGGALIPERDSLLVAAVAAPDVERALSGEAAPLGVTLRAMHTRLRNTPIVESVPGAVNRAKPVSTAAVWATLEYVTALPTPLRGQAELHVERTGVAHGLLVWFAAVLAGEHGFSNAPGKDTCYRRLFLPWPRPLSLTEGDTISVDIWAQADGELWGWNTSVISRQGESASFKQSSFLSYDAKPRARAYSRAGLPLLDRHA